MAADVKLLPLPPARLVIKHDRGPISETEPFWNRRDVSDYARACVAHATAAKDAEAEALRAASCGDACAHIAIERDMLQARAERLAEALRKLSADLRTLAGGETPDGDGVPVNVILWAEKRLAALSIAIDQEEWK